MRRWAQCSSFLAKQRREGTRHRRWRAANTASSSLRRLNLRVLCKCKQRFVFLLKGMEKKLSPSWPSPKSKPPKKKVGVSFLDLISPPSPDHLHLDSYHRPPPPSPWTRGRALDHLNQRDATPPTCILASMQASMRVGPGRKHLNLKKRYPVQEGNFSFPRRFGQNSACV